MLTTRRAVLGGGAAAILAGVAPRAAWATTEADVIIIGAGLAGLNAARILSFAGQRVVVLEGSNRVGGRLHTLDDVPGRPEAGGVQVGSNYRRLLGLAADMGVPMVAGGAEERTALYHVNGATMRGDAWPSHVANRLSDAERAVLPAALGGFYGQRLPRLATVDAWREPAQWALLDRPYAAMLRELGASDEAIRLINANLNGNSVDTLSALHVAKAGAIFRSAPGAVQTIGGGSQRFPEALARTLLDPVRRNQRVTGISADGDGVRVLLANGRPVRARHVIVTIPFAAMRQLPIDAALAPEVRQAIATLPYTRALFLYLAARTAFWRDDGGPATLWTDDPLIGRVFALGDAPPMVKIWIAGPNVAAAERFSPETLARRSIAAIERARPAARGQLRLQRHFSWQRDPMARGIYHHLGAGQAAMLSAAAGAIDIEFELERRTRFGRVVRRVSANVRTIQQFIHEKRAFG